MNTETLNTDDLAFLAALQAQLAGEHTDRRHDQRYELCMAVALTPADTSRASEAVVQGETIDVSYSGIKAELPTPPQVGDHYRLQLRAQAGKSVTVFARCVRCALIDDTRFEVALSFLMPIAADDLPLDSL